MSTLWTPGGEHPVDPENAPPSSDFSELSPEEQEQAEALAAEMAAVREQLAAAPAEIVVANHLMGLYELAAIHLSIASTKGMPEAIKVDKVSHKDATSERKRSDPKSGIFKIRLSTLNLPDLLS